MSNNKRVTELKNLQEKVGEKFITDQICKEQYDRLTKECHLEIVELQVEIDKTDQMSSNLDIMIEKGLFLAENLSKI